MIPTRIIFLDIDGVLRPMNQEFLVGYCRSTGDRLFDPECVGVLNAIVRLTKARIVVHSAWRMHKKKVRQLAGWLRANGVVGPIVGRTPEWPDSHMEEEIAWWLDKHEWGQYIVIDDSNFNPLPSVLRDHYLQTDSLTGLRRDYVLPALKLFGIKP